MKRKKRERIKLALRDYRLVEGFPDVTKTSSTEEGLLCLAAAPFLTADNSVKANVGLDQTSLEQKKIDTPIVSRRVY